MKKILITGDTGFMGHHLLNKLGDYDVDRTFGRTTDLIDYTSLAKFKDYKYDWIIHLACNTKAGDWCKYNKYTQWSTNQAINHNMIKYWVEFQPQAKFITIGTSCAYGHSPLKEELYGKYIPADPDLEVYGLTKIMLLKGLQAAEEQYGMDNWLYIIPSTLYGPNYQEGDRHFIFDLMRKIRAGVEKEEPVILWGDGEQKREIIYIDDFLLFLQRLIFSEAKGVFNIGRGVEFTINYYSKKICELYGYDFDAIMYDKDAYVGVRSKKLIITKLIKTIGDYGATTVADGLKKIYDEQPKISPYCSGVN